MTSSSIQVVFSSFLTNWFLMSDTIWSPNSLALAEKAFSTKNRERIQPTPSSAWLTHVRQRSGVESGSYGRISSRLGLVYKDPSGGDLPFLAVH